MGCRSSGLSREAKDPLLRNDSQKLLHRDTNVFPSEMGHVRSPVCPGSALDRQVWLSSPERHLGEPEAPTTSWMSSTYLWGWVYHSSRETHIVFSPPFIFSTLKPSKYEQMGNVRWGQVCHLQKSRNGIPRPSTHYTFNHLAAHRFSINRYYELNWLLNYGFHP